MKYVPDLIPEQARVLPDYFKSQPVLAKAKSKFYKVLLWILGVYFYCLALACLLQPLLLLLFAAIGTLLLPPGQRYLERRLRLRFTPWAKTMVCLLLLFCALPLLKKHLAHDVLPTDKPQALSAAGTQPTQPEKPQTTQPVKPGHADKQDSLQYYIRRSNELSKQHKTAAAIKLLEQATPFAQNAAAQSLLQQELTGLRTRHAGALVQSGQYKAALPLISQLLDADPANKQLLVQRAMCYSKTGKIEEAVNELRPLLQSGNEAAEKLHDKINPVRKRVIGYETLCCDGSTSNARGRGACSHHGGVCDWNQPIYEEYRKYE